MIISILSGLAAGSAHVVTGPDHLAALAPIAADQPKRAAMLGVRWGLGHGLGVIALGALGIVARSAVDVDAISAVSELIVGFLLVAMGLWALRRAARMVVHSHDHHHDDDGDHAHLHVHASAEAHDAAAHGGHAHAAFLVGMLHGAAGAGHLFGVLPSLALPTPHAIAYLAAYFIAAVLSMGIFGALMGRFVRHWGQNAMRRVMYGVSTIAVGVGALWIVQAWPG